jgi:hypothetical protein
MRRPTMSVLVIAAILGCVPTAVDAEPISPLYLTRNGSISVVQGGGVVNSWPSPSYGELPIAVDDTVRTWGYHAGFIGHEYTLNGVATGTAYWNTFGGAFYDGTTDGAANYSVHYPSGNVYQFNSDWTTPTLLFSGLFGVMGITYDPTDTSLWLLEYANNSVLGTQVQHRTLSGGMIGVPFFTGYKVTAALALDHADNSLWLVDNANSANSVLRQYSKAGAPLSSQSLGPGFVYGGEFAFTSVPDHANTSMLLLGSGLLCAGLRWRSRRPIG